MNVIRSIAPRACLLAVSSALLQIFMFPTSGPVSFFRSATCWFALVPLLVALSLPNQFGRPLKLRQAALLGYLCGTLWYAGNCFWIYQTMFLCGGLPKPVSFVILVLFALYLGLYHALFSVCFVVIRRTRGGVAAALWLTPALWVMVELVRGRLTGFPWDLLGYAQVDNLWLTRLAPLAGVMSISFVIAAINASLASYFFLAGNKRFWFAACGIAAAVVLSFGSTPFIHASAFEATTQQAVLMQENLAVGAAAREVEPIAPNEELQVFSALSLQPQAGAGHAATSSPSLLVWPEAPSHFFTSDANFRGGIGRLAQAMQAPAIIGALGVDRAEASSKGYNEFDSAALFDAEGTYKERYDKVHLVPWGEYIPYPWLFSFAKKLTEGAGDMQPGRERTVFRTGGHTYGVFVCYESIFGDEVRDFAENGAEVLVNISNDGWYGDTGAPWQHLNMARMRAIENHRWVLRSTNTGVTTAIDPYGRMVYQAPRHVRAAYSFAFAFEQGTTFYTQWGDWFAYVCTVLACFGLFVCQLQWVRRRT